MRFTYSIIVSILHKKNSKKKDRSIYKFAIIFKLMTKKPLSPKKQKCPRFQNYKNSSSCQNYKNAFSCHQNMFLTRNHHHLLIQIQAKTLLFIQPNTSKIRLNITRNHHQLLIQIQAKTLLFIQLNTSKIQLNIHAKSK